MAVLTARRSVRVSWGYVVFSVKRVPRVEWAQQRFMGPGSFVIDEDDVMGAWNGTEYSASGSGAPYLGPQTMAQLQAGAYADGTPGLLALAKDAVVYDPAGLCSYVPNAAGTAWTVGRAGQEVSIADLATRMSLGRPVPVGVQLIDRATGKIYGQSDGAGSYSALGGSTVSSEYHTHFFAPLATGTDRKAWDISGALSDGVFQTDLSAATAWATAGFLTQPNPSVANALTLVAYPAISWDWSAGDSLFLFWVGRGTPEGTDTGWLGDTSGYVSGNGIRLVCTPAGAVKANAYQTAGSLSCFGATSSSVVIEPTVTHSFAVCYAPAGICYWVDGVRNAGHAAGFLPPANNGLSTVTSATLKIGGDGGVASNVQNGIALQTKALVVLKGRRGRPPAVADLDALVLALHRNSQALVSSEAW